MIVKGYRRGGRRLTMKTNGPSASEATAAAAVAGVLAHPARRATPETLSLDSVTTTQPHSTAEPTRSCTTVAQVIALGCASRKFLLTNFAQFLLCVMDAERDTVVTKSSVCLSSVGIRLYV